MEPKAGLIGIVVAIISAIVILYQLKSSIISKARLQWIERLRNSLSAYLMEAYNVVFYF